MYLLVKTLHILSATVLFGTGIGTAFFMLRSYLGRNREHFLHTVGSVVLADWVFTSPAVVLQLVTGLWLSQRLGIDVRSVWFLTVLALYVLVGLCWLPVVGIQVRIHNRLKNGDNIQDCRWLMVYWAGLGVPAFASVIVIFALMVYKPWLQVQV